MPEGRCRPKDILLHFPKTEMLWKPLGISGNHRSHKYDNPGIRYARHQTVYS